MELSLKSVCLCVYACESLLEYLCVRVKPDGKQHTLDGLCLFTSSLLCAQPSERTQGLCNMQSSLFYGHSMKCVDGTSMKEN